MAQKSFNYDSAWKKVETFQKKQLPKSALEEVNKIYMQAKKDGQEAQQVMALITRGNLTQQVEEGDWYKNALAFEQETNDAKEPIKQILHSISAELYWGYFQNKRWQIYNRTATVNFKKDDPETWTKQDFFTIIDNHYRASLQNPALLQRTLLEKYDPIIIKGNQRTLRPTLFDLLAHKALDYYKQGEEETTKPAYQFELTDMASLADAKTFVRYNYTSPDSSSHELMAIKLYQDLIKFHLADDDKSALLDVDIARLVYAYGKSVMEGKKQLYKEALENLLNQYSNTPEVAQAGYLLAVWWQSKGDDYKPGIGTEEDKNALAEAVRISKEISTKYPKTEGGINASNLLSALLQPSTQLRLEKVNVIGQPFRALVEYKNINGIYLRLIKVDEEVQKEIDRQEENYDADRYWKKLAKLKPIKSWQQPLPEIKDYRKHSVEIKVDGLPHGKYILFSSRDEDFGLSRNPLAAATLHVSNISYVNSGKEYFVLHRETGKPLPQTTVQLWETKYEYKKRQNELTKDQTYSTDEHGYFKMKDPEKPKQNYTNFRMEFTTGNDHLFLEDDNYQYYPNYYNNNNNKTPVVKTDWDHARYFIFTDRSIYRPGQTVYFKAIGITKKENERNSSLFLPGTAVTVELYDINQQRIDSMDLKPNEYGSINGQFKLPSSGLTGEFHIKVKIPQESSTSFNVEEYKRPKFYVDFEKMKGTYKLNDTIQVTGTAKAYAGNNIDGAVVKYTVKRNTRFLYPWLFWGRGKTIWPPYGRDEMVITHGETTTGADGKFYIDFKAIPDLGTDKALDPTFDYTVEADITDLNGESRSGSKIVSVGYKSLVINIVISGGMQQNLDSFKTIKINATNLADEPESTLVRVKIYSLKVPERLIRERYWEQPDTTVMSYAEFVKNFPHDEYRNEGDYKTWQKNNLVQEDTLTTGIHADLAIHSLSAGYYVIEASSKDKDGNDVKAVEYVAITDIKNNKLPAPNYNVTQTIKGTVQPGDKATFLHGSSATDLNIVQQTLKKSVLSIVNNESKDYSSKFDYEIHNSQFTIHNFPATEADRGGYTVIRFFVKDNRIYSTTWVVNVPWTNKELKISFETFRDKLLPGQEEKWKVKISGYKGDVVAAEMLASMYDASLDKFDTHNWQGLNIWNPNNFGQNWSGRQNFIDVQGGSKEVYTQNKYFEKRYDVLKTIDGAYSLHVRGGASMYASRALDESVSYNYSPSAPSMQNEMVMDRLTEAKSAAPRMMAWQSDGDGAIADTTLAFIENSPLNDAPIDNSSVQIRKNFNETAFFFPDLHTNEKGEIEFSFTIPEALTQWKLQTLAHTKDLQTAMATKTIVTQKQLMVQPNAPRFFRQGDSLHLVAKVVNLTDKELTGTAQLQLLNAATLQPVDDLFKNGQPLQNITIPAGQSMAVNFPMAVPFGFNDPVMYRIIAKAGDVSDGEEMALPVLTNRMLVTESFPINLRGTNSKSFTWDKLLQSAQSPTLQNQSLTVEYTSNPTWYAVQALPYLMEYPYDCAEQTWNRFYANALAGKIANSTPKIKAIFEQWKNLDSSALQSNLQKNQELKAVLLEETPWVLEAKSEAEQKKNIGLLFDMVRMSGEAEKALSKLKDLQSENGGFVWFKGGPDDRYMTQYILTGIGHLQKLEAWPQAQAATLQEIVDKAIPYLDARLKEEYDNLIKYKTKLNQDNLSYTAEQFLYMRSFFPTIKMANASVQASEYYTSQAKKYWTNRGKYDQGMIALALFRDKDSKTPNAILKSLTENSISNEEFGMYWKEFNSGGYYWWQAPIESHSLLIEAFSEIENNTKRVDDLKTWLLKQKQTQNWRTTKATAEACYALLLQGSNWLNVEQKVDISLGSTHITSPTNGVEAGTGYFKQTIEGSKVTPGMGNINVTITPASFSTTSVIATSWGSVYWQYFEDLDKITPAATPLQLSKKLFKVSNTDRGEVLAPIADNNLLKIGDKVRVRIELRADRNMEYMHLKDMRASCFEPVNVLSSYKYQDGLGYYEATRDASTNFFISYLNKGTYVFEYTLLVTHSGNFSNGISSIQCMYAPEFTAHSEGVRVMVND